MWYCLGYRLRFSSSPPIISLLTCSCWIFPFPHPPPSLALFPSSTRLSLPFSLSCTLCLHIGQALPLDRMPRHVHRRCCLSLALHVPPQELAATRAHVHVCCYLLHVLLCHVDRHWRRVRAPLSQPPPARRVFPPLAHTIEIT